jgi:hypothetical protein
LDGGVEAGDDGLRLAEQGVDGGGAFDPREVVAVFAGVAGVEGIAVGAEVFDEIGGEFVGVWTLGRPQIPRNSVASLLAVAMVLRWSFAVNSGWRL